MKCLNHQRNDAVAICRGCGRGMCQDCVYPTDSGARVCSEDCDVVVRRERLILEAAAESAIAQHRSNRLVVTMLRTLSVLCGLMAIGSAAGSFWMARRLRQPFEPVQEFAGYGISAVLIALSAACVYCARNLAKVEDRFSKLETPVSHGSHYENQFAAKSSAAPGRDVEQQL